MKQIKFLVLTIFLFLSGCNGKISISNSSSSNSITTSSSSELTSSSSISSSSSTIDKEELDLFFQNNQFVPFLFENSVTIPNYYKEYKIDWKINFGNSHLLLSKNVNTSTIKKNNNSLTSGIIEIQAIIRKLSYSYTYYTVVNSSEMCEIPLINIITDDLSVTPDNLDKEVYTPGYVSIINYLNGEYVMDLSNQKMGIRMRGNSTTGALKKAFRIKFDSKQSVLGKSKAKSWVLLANYFDKSNLRNYLAYTMAQKMENLEFQPSAIFVEVNFNNTYQGLYLLSEQMETGEGRVDIENQYDIDGYPGYFFELDERLDDEGSGAILDYDYFVLNNVESSYGAIYNWCLEYKYPDPEILTNEIKYRAEYLFNNANRAIKKLITKSDSLDYEEYIDVDSFIDYYLVQELFKNVDVASTSQFYVIKPGGKIQMGPVWDFDIALGVVGSYVYDVYNNIDLFVRYRDPWYNCLFLSPYFLEKVTNRYSEIKDTIINDVYESIDNLLQKYEKAFNKNAQCWPLNYQSYDPPMFIEANYSPYYMALNSFEEHYQYLKDQLKLRIEILDANYL